MTFDIAEGHLSKPSLIKRLPKILVEHWFSCRSAPALALPTSHPTAESVDQVFAIGTESEIRMKWQFSQTLQGGKRSL
jgi:hypothetical protein